MDIKAFSNVSMPFQSVVKKQNKKSSSADESASENQKSLKQNVKAALPYVAGAVVLAGLGVYAYKNKGKMKQAFGEAKKVINETVHRAENKVSNKIAPEMEKKAETVVEDVKPVVVEKTLETNHIAEKAVDANKKTKNNLNMKQLRKVLIKNKTEKLINETDMHNPEILAKIERNRQTQQNEITRIINENLDHEGRVNLKTMDKICSDYMKDVEGRGEDRFHQAADLMEQSLIKNAVMKLEYGKIDGLEIYNNLAPKTTLFDIYKQMPIEEACTRIKRLEEKEFNAETYIHPPVAEDWFKECMELFVRKAKLFYEN